jgi:hypothetical protein
MQFPVRNHIVYFPIEPTSSPINAVLMSHLDKYKLQFGNSLNFSQKIVMLHSL